MKRDIDILLADTLFNGNVRPTTRKALLLAALRGAGSKTEAFLKALEAESSNPENIDADQRQRDRSGSDEGLDLKQKELRLLQGKGLQS